MFNFQIKDSRLRFRFNLNSLKTEEKMLWLTYVPVDDGQWHTAKVSRYGSTAILELDGGEGKKYNETFRFEGHQWMQVDKQEGVYAGGKAGMTLLLLILHSGNRLYKLRLYLNSGCIEQILPVPAWEMGFLC